VIVLDASAMLEWLLRTPTGLQIRARVLPSIDEVYAPHLLYLETVQSLRKSVRAQTVSVIRAQEALQDLLDFPLNLYEHQPFLRRIWALRDNATAYDAVYLALAELLPATLLTCDSKLASTPGHSAKIEWFGTHKV